ncbi:MAG: gamma-glutamyl-gamma-aminobutyrate hydrolase family protein [Gemmatimonadetes bacterium]|nr:gamma-glutamyl-gamma-aminobutyrate hydrolase family protein [Gemmatimonadota bacterium]
MTRSHLIAVSATASVWDGAERVRLWSNYVRSLEGAGLVPLIVPPLRIHEVADDILAACGGLLLTGGEDVAPQLYGAEPHAAVTTTHPMRDATELALFAAATARRLPVFAICRGIQLVNVAMGGTLLQDIPSQHPSSISHDQPGLRALRRHAVSLAAGSRMAVALKTTELDVNTYHHQAIDRIATGLSVTATAPDGIIEGAESVDPKWWMVAVQWHPEDLIDDGTPWAGGLFAAFGRVVRHEG